MILHKAKIGYSDYGKSGNFKNRAKYNYLINLIKRNHVFPLIIIAGLNKTIFIKILFYKRSFQRYVTRPTFLYQILKLSRLCPQDPKKFKQKRPLRIGWTCVLPFSRILTHFLSFIPKNTWHINIFYISLSLYLPTKKNEVRSIKL